MNKVRISSILISIFLITPAFAQEEETTITIVNHFNQTLNYEVGINPEILPDLPEKFSLESNNQISSRIIKANKEAYIRAEAAEKNKKSAFFGVMLKNHKVKYYGYISEGIAFSWDKDMITFCTPEDFRKRNAC